MDRRLRWGVMGTGMISTALVHAIPTSSTGELVAVASRSLEKAKKWAAENKTPRAYGSYEELLADKDIDAVYIALPNSEHCRWVVAAAEAGKHILCEKPLALNAAEVMVMQEACRANKVFFMEAFMWRCHPGTARWLEEIRKGTIGEIRTIEAQFSFNCGDSYESNRFSNELGWGGIMDVGCYTMSAARLIAGAANGQPFAEPISLAAAGHVGKTNVDDWSCALVKFPGDIVANLTTGLRVNNYNMLRVFGSKGKLIVPSPWFHEGKFRIEKDNGESQDFFEESGKNLYAHEVDMLGHCVREGRLEAHAPGMTWADSIGQQKAIDQWRRAVGVTFQAETDEALSKATLSGKPLRFGSKGKIPTATLPHLTKPVSRVIMGSMALRFDDMPYTCAVMDDYFERGGNACDSAWVYGPNCEKALGRWIKLRGIRDQFVILAKGAHLACTNRPFLDKGCDPETLRREFFESLERLETDYVDIYCMHRDNPLIPVGEFVDVLNELVRAGHIKTFGGSNWTPARIDEANAYAKSKGLQGFSVLSNNFSLAQWNEPMWGHCFSSADEESKQWLKQTGIPLLAWSSQASGFFTGAFDRDTDPTRDGWTREVARVWFNEDNFRRLDRARELAKKKNVTPTQIALAYVLNQSFETFALFGPRTLEETRTSLQGVDLKLTTEEVRWLNLESDSLT